MTLSITDTEHNNALHCECSYTEKRVLFIVIPMPSVVILNVIMLSVVMLNVTIQHSAIG
jgi:hypothetical protein